MLEEINIEDDVIEEPLYEIRGYGDEWRVSYPEEGGLKSPLPVYDKEGNYKETLWVGEPSGKLTEANMVWPNAKAAIKDAENMGATNIKLVKIKKKVERKRRIKGLNHGS